eukprot:COSAG01_NODE_24727_length_768_cov_1358.953662_2_plen_105_part_01
MHARAAAAGTRRSRPLRLSVELLAFSMVPFLSLLPTRPLHPPQTRAQTRCVFPPDLRWARGLQRWPLPGRLLRPDCADHVRSAIIARAAPVPSSPLQIQVPHGPP